MDWIHRSYIGFSLRILNATFRNQMIDRLSGDDIFLDLWYDVYFWNGIAINHVIDVELISMIGPEVARQYMYHVIPRTIQCASSRDATCSINFRFANLRKSNGS